MPPMLSVKSFADNHGVGGAHTLLLAPMLFQRPGQICFADWEDIKRALRTMGYDTKEQITGHGFRATVRTMIREHLGWDPDVIERHLAHTSGEELGSSYDRAEFTLQRKAMVQQWADFLDELEASKLPQPDSKVLQFIREKPRSEFRLRA